MRCLNCQEIIQVSVADKVINCGDTLVVPVICPTCKAINDIVFSNPSVVTVHTKEETE